MSKGDAPAPLTVAEDSDHPVMTPELARAIVAIIRRLHDERESSPDED